MSKKSTLKLFEDKKVRTVWDEEQGKWYISIGDVVEVLTDSQLATNCSQLKMQSADGKYYKTDVADVEQMNGRSGE